MKKYFIHSIILAFFFCFFTINFAFAIKSKDTSSTEVLKQQSYSDETIRIIQYNKLRSNWNNGYKEATKLEYIKDYKINEELPLIKNGNFNIKNENRLKQKTKSFWNNKAYPFLEKTYRYIDPCADSKEFGHNNIKFDNSWDDL